jgi:c-di-GMP-binding flagellar brake protein YcgR
VRKVKSKGVEKRKFFRLDIPLNITIRVLTDEKVPGGVRPLKVQSSNISQQGICVETRQIVVDSVNMLSGSPGARENLLDMEIELIPGESPVKAIGEVCWYDVARETEEFVYQVGIVFIEFKGSGKEQIKKFLKGHEKSKSFFNMLSSLLKS